MGSGIPSPEIMTRRRRRRRRTRRRSDDQEWRKISARR
jgi:hypothetical protein